MSDETVGPDPVLVIAEIYAPLLRTARSLVGPELAVDVVHDTLIEMLSRHPRLADINNPLAYGRVTMTRLSYSSIRRGRREIPSGDTMELLSGALPDDSDAVVDKMFVEQSLVTLGRRQRACLVLSYLYRLTDREIAEVLGCRPSTVCSQIARGLKTIRAALGRTEDAAGPTIFESQGR